MNEKLYVLILFHGLNVERIHAFGGEPGAEAAKQQFQDFTGVSYEEYTQRRNAGEDNQEVLEEDEEGTEIYVMDVWNGLALNTAAQDGIPYWRYGNS